MLPIVVAEAVVDIADAGRFWLGVEVLTGTSEEGVAVVTGEGVGFALGDEVEWTLRGLGMGFGVELGVLESD